MCSAAGGRAWHRGPGADAHGLVRLRCASFPEPSLRSRPPAVPSAGAWGASGDGEHADAETRARCKQLPPVAACAGGGATTLTVNNVVLKPDPVWRPPLPLPPALCTPPHGQPRVCVSMHAGQTRAGVQQSCWAAALHLSGCSSCRAHAALCTAGGHRGKLHACARLHERRADHSRHFCHAGVPRGHPGIDVSHSLSLSHHYLLSLSFSLSRLHV